MSLRLQDFIVAMLCDLDVAVMSVQNAASWGYFNTQEKSWNTKILSEAQFPTRFLPEVVLGGDYAGKLTGSAWHLIPVGTGVGAGMVMNDKIIIWIMTIFPMK